MSEYSFQDAGYTSEYLMAPDGCSVVSTYVDECFNVSDSLPLLEDIVSIIPSKFQLKQSIFRMVYLMSSLLVLISVVIENVTLCQCQSVWNPTLILTVFGQYYHYILLEKS